MNCHINDYYIVRDRIFTLVSFRYLPVSAPDWHNSTAFVVIFHLNLPSFTRVRSQYIARFQFFNPPPWCCMFVSCGVELPYRLTDFDDSYVNRFILILQVSLKTIKFHQNENYINFQKTFKYLNVEGFVPALLGNLQSALNPKPYVIVKLCQNTISHSFCYLP